MSPDDKVAQVTTEDIARRYDAAVTPAVRKLTALSFARGEGVYVYDFEGRRYLDFAAGIATNVLGHAHPAILEAITTQADRLLHGAIHIGYYLPYVEMAEALKRISPGRLQKGKVMLVNSGTEAVESALKLARAVTGRPMVLAFLGGFHGRTMGSLAATASNAAFRRGLVGLLNGVFHVPYPVPIGAFWGALPAENRAQACIDYIEYVLTTAVPPEDLAAVLVEPILGEGGYVVPPQGFLKQLRELCSRRGALLIADEVQTGFGRTGRWFAVEHSNVEPDILCAAKAAGGGLPLGGIIADAELMDKWPTGAHGSTFGGNPLACAAGLAAIAVIEREGLLAQAREVGALILRRLREAAAGLPAIGDLRGFGLMIGVELRGTPARPTPTLVKRAVELAASQGLLVIPSGQTVIRLCPPLILTKEQAEAGVSILTNAIKEASAAPA